jgi:hypothetical protein
MARERFTIENTRLMFPNFSGAPDRFNQTPKPNASIVVPPEMVQGLTDRGFRIRHLDAREGFEDDAGLDLLVVKASYGGRGDPKIVLLMAEDGAPPQEWSRRLLTSEEVGELDRLDIDYVDITFTPYEFRGFTSAYIDSMYVVCRPDRLMSKYGI